MNTMRSCIKELEQLIDYARAFNELNPVFEELQKPKYKFAKAKEKYKAEHESELRRFFMAKRKLKEAGFEKAPFPLSSWEKELAELSIQNEEVYQEYRTMNSEMKTLWTIKSDVDKILREQYPELNKKEKSKETTL